MASPMSSSEPTAETPHDTTLLRLQQQGAGLLPDPEKILRMRAAAIAAAEETAMDAAFKSAGCIPIYPEEENS